MINIKNYLFLLFLILFTHNNLYSLTFSNDKKIETLFEQEKVNGTIIIYNNQKNLLTGYNYQRANVEYAPASTFKIVNSLIALSSGVVKSVDDVFFKYQGQEVFLDSWKQDSSLRDAIKVSNFLAYQELAKKIGREKMLANLKKLNYGNMTIGSNLDSFWVDNSIKVSAMQQVDFLYKLANKKLPYSKKTQQDIASIILLEESANYKLYGKTGWFVPDNSLNTLGWFVGWVEKNNEIYAFAINIDINKANKNDFPIQELEKRKELAIKSLKFLKIIE